MIYEIKNGYSVAKEGTVIINTVQHYVKNGYVACDSGLNSRSWNTTEKQSVCPICSKYIVKNPIQLKLCFN